MKHHALVVEDNPWFARILRSVLERARCSANHAANVREAAHALESRCPDLIVLNDALADGDSLDVMHAVWRIHGQAMPKMPVILMHTPNGHEVDLTRVQAMRERGSAVHRVAKPLDLPTFEALVRDCLAPSIDADGRARPQALAPWTDSRATAPLLGNLGEHGANGGPGTSSRVRTGPKDLGDLWIDGDWGVER